MAKFVVSLVSPQTADRAMSLERWTDRARKCGSLATEETRRLGHAETGTGHLLLGIIAEGESVAWQVLARLRVTETRARAELSSALRPGTAGPDHVPAMSAGLRKVCELALREALILGNNYVGAEHLLLALVRDGKSEGAAALDRMAGLSRVRAAMLARLSYSRGHRSESRRRTKFVGVRFSPAEYEALTDAMARTGKPAGGLLRETFLTAEDRMLLHDLTGADERKRIRELAIEHGAHFDCDNDGCDGTPFADLLDGDAHD